MFLLKESGFLGIKSFPTFQYSGILLKFCFLLLSYKIMMKMLITAFAKILIFPGQLISEKISLVYI